MRNLVGSVFLVVILVSCMEFRLSHESTFEQFEEVFIKPNFDSIQVNDRKIHYAFTDQKKDSLVIFIHGSPGSWSAFVDFFKADSLLDRMDMISIDRPGFGNSDYGVPEISLEKQAYLMQEVVDRFPHKTKILVGHSLGGPVIARMAMDFPEVYSKIVLVAPSIDPELEVDGAYRKWLQNRLSQWILPTDFWVSNEEIIPLKGELEKMTDLWSLIKCEVVVIQGTKDSLVPKENADYAMKMVKDSLLTLHLLEGVDHFIPWSHPHEIAKVLY